MNDQKFSKSILSSPNRIKFGTLTLSTLSSGLTEVSMKPLSKNPGSRGRVGHKARSRENLRMAFLEASPLGSRITSRIAVIISRGRGSEGSVAESRTIQHTKRSPLAPSYRRPSDRQEPRNVQLFQPQNPPPSSSSPPTRLVYVLKKLIKSTTKLRSPRVIRFQILLEFFRKRISRYLKFEKFVSLA